MLIEARPALDPELAALVTAFVPDHDAHHLVVVVGGRAVACGAWRAAGTGVAELTRMYVRPSFRGRGIARQLIVAIEEEAFAESRPVIRLEIGTDLPAAIALYQSAGYRQMPATGDAGGVRFEKRLGALVQ